MDDLLYCVMSRSPSLILSIRYPSVRLTLLCFSEFLFCKEIEFLRLLVDGMMELTELRV